MACTQVRDALSKARGGGQNLLTSLKVGGRDFEQGFASNLAMFPDLVKAKIGSMHAPAKYFVFSAPMQRLIDLDIHIHLTTAGLAISIDTICTGFPVLQSLALSVSGENSYVSSKDWKSGRRPAAPTLVLNAHVFPATLEKLHIQTVSFSLESLRHFVCGGLKQLQLRRFDLTRAVERHRASYGALLPRDLVLAAEHAEMEAVLRSSASGKIAVSVKT